MSRQNDRGKRQFFQKSIQRAQAVQKKKKEIQSIKYGNIVEPDPVSVIETQDEQVPDLEIVDSE